MSRPCSLGFSLASEAVSKQHTNPQNPQVFIHFQPVHKRNRNFHKICWKLDLTLHDLSQFLIYLLTEKSINYYNHAKSNAELRSPLLQ